MSKNNKGAPAATKQSQGTHPTKPTYTTLADTSPLYIDSQVPKELLLPYPCIVDMNILAIQMEEFLKKHCILNDDEIVAIVLWIISSYLINSFRIFPNLTIISPEKRCGKSTVMELISSMCRDAKMTSSITPAVLYRATVKYQPTLLIDEADTHIKTGSAGLIGLVNSGHQYSTSKVLRCDGENYAEKEYRTWAPKVLASIGDLHSTIMDRSVVLNIRRKLPSEHVYKIPQDIAKSNKRVREMTSKWCLDNLHQIKRNTIHPSNLGNDRAIDNWCPLFTIASMIGGQWEKKCEQAYQALIQKCEKEPSTQLLADTREIMHALNVKRIKSADLAQQLNSDKEKPWHQYNNGKILTPNIIAGMFRPYGISPKAMRFPPDTKTARGYEATSFQDAFDRYLDPVSNVTVQQP